MTLNELKIELEEFGYDHYMIGSVLYTTPEKVDTTNTNGAVMWFYNNGVAVQGTSREVKMQVVFMDVLNKNMDNEKDALSDCDKIMDDFIATMDYEQYIHGFQFERSTEMSNFVHEHGSDYVGISAEFSFMLPETYDYCEIPQ